MARKIAIAGVPTETAVYMIFSQGGQAVTINTPEWGVVYNGQTEIEVSLPQTLVAPSQVWVKAINTTGLASFGLSGATYRPEFHEHHYVWTINGEPLAAWNAPQNMIPEWNNPNRASGQEVGFCLPVAGDYTIELLVIDRLGNTAVAVTDVITVVDPDVQYPGADTICFSVDGIFTGKPTGAAEVTTLAALESHLTTRNLPNTRVLFRRGEVYEIIELDLQGTKQATYLGAFGPETARPDIRPPVSTPGAETFCVRYTDHFGGNPADVKTITVAGLRFSSDWDVTSETGHLGANQMLSITSSKYENTHFMFYDLDFEGCNISLALGPTVRTYDTFNRFMVADCAFTGWKDYGIFAYQLPGDKIAVIGDRIAQNPDALRGGAKEIGFMNNHGPCRLADVTGVYVAMNDIFSCTGWSGQDQQCLRTATSAIPNQWSIVNRNVMEGGYLIVSLEGQNAAENDIPGNHLIDGNLMIATAANSLDYASVHRGGTTIRGNYGYTSAAPYVRSASAAKAAFSFVPDNSHPGNETEPVTLDSNTVLVMRDNAQANDVPYSMSAFETFTNSRTTNDVFHAPNRTPADVSFAPMDLTQTISGVTLRYKGTRIGFNPVTFTMTAEVPDGGTLSIPYASFHQDIAGDAGTANIDDLGGPTDQAYWLALDPTDLRHSMSIPDTGIGLLGAHLGHFLVDFSDPTNMVITNTSGVTWTINDPVLTLKMHRNAKIPARDTSYGHDGQSVPLPVPASDQSAAWDSAAGPFKAALGFLDRAPRTAPVHQGAI